MADILVVDDSKVMRDMIVACLRPSWPDFAFTHASSGLEAIERLSLKRFDLVVLDLNMPDIGGIEVVEFVRGQDTLRDLPIIIVTTRGDDASRARSLEAGASRFMTKPLPSLLRRSCKKSRRWSPPPRVLGATGGFPLSGRVDLAEVPLGLRCRGVDEQLVVATAKLLAIEQAERKGQALTLAASSATRFGRSTRSRASRRWSASTRSSPSRTRWRAC